MQHVFRAGVVLNARQPPSPFPSEPPPDLLPPSGQENVFSTPLRPVRTADGFVHSTGKPTVRSYRKRTRGEAVETTVDGDDVRPRKIQVVEPAVARLNFEKELQKSQEATERQLEMQRTLKIRLAIEKLRELKYTKFEFLQDLFTVREEHFRSSTSRMLGEHGTEILDWILELRPDVAETWMAARFSEIICGEAARLEEYLRPSHHTSTQDLLHSFSLQTIVSETRQRAPYLYALLLNIASKPAARQAHSNAASRNSVNPPVAMQELAIQVAERTTEARPGSRILYSNSESDVEGPPAETNSSRTPAPGPSGSLDATKRRPRKRRSEAVKAREAQHQREITIVTTVCMLIRLRNQHATRFQSAIGLYFLATGAARTQFDLLHRAGLSISYRHSLDRLKALSLERLTELRSVVRTNAFLVIWDNLNIAFRVTEQRDGKKDHFDSGTTATVIPLYGVKPGDLPLHLKPPRTTHRPIQPFDASDTLIPTDTLQALQAAMLWHIEDVLYDAYPFLRKRFGSTIPGPPSIKNIPLHKTKQYPLPAMHIDESSLEGTLNVLRHIFKDTLHLSGEDFERSGLVICAGDQLSISLLDKAHAARRDDTELEDNLWRYTVGQLGLFHVRLAGCRMVANEFWGKPNAPVAWSLWKLNSLLARKSVSVGWEKKSPAPFRQSWELILALALPAHVLDGFRIFGSEPANQSAAKETATNASTQAQPTGPSPPSHLSTTEGIDPDVEARIDPLEPWLQQLKTRDEILPVIRHIYENMCCGRRVEELRELPDSERDVQLENIILFMREALILREFSSAIRRGDIGSVMVVLAWWQNVFRGTGKMPKYADALFLVRTELKNMAAELREAFLNNWLSNPSGRALGFVENDLLQEFQNKWDKIVYLASGSNRSWDHLSTISLCIFELRDLIKRLQKEFKTSHNGTTHTSPSTAKDVRKIRDYLQKLDLQIYKADRDGNKDATVARDLFTLGAEYVDTAGAFKNFRPYGHVVSFKKVARTSSGVSEDNQPDRGDSVDSEAGLTEAGLTDDREHTSVHDLEYISGSLDDEDLAMEDDGFLPHADLDEMVNFVENLTGGLMDDSDDDLEFNFL